MSDEDIRSGIMLALRALEEEFPPSAGFKPSVSLGGADTLMFTCQPRPGRIRTRPFPSRDWPEDPKEWGEAIINVMSHGPKD